MSFGESESWNMDDIDKVKHQSNVNLLTLMRIVATAAKDASALDTVDFRRAFGYLGHFNASGKRPAEMRRRIAELGFMTTDDLEHAKKLIEGGARYGYFASFARLFSMTILDGQQFAELCDALLGEDPRSAVRELLDDCDGKLDGLGVSAFTQSCFLLQPSLFPVCNDRSWDDSWSEWIDDEDYYPYPMLAEELDRICDRVGIPREYRFLFVDESDWSLLDLRVPPPDLKKLGYSD